MSVLAWTDELSIDHGPMDEIHVEFVELLNALHEATDADALAALDAFVAHSMRHFAAEEAWMAASDFPRTYCHVEQHHALLQVTREVRARIAGGEGGLARLLAQAVAGWFRDHASTMDTMLAHWMEDRGYLPRTNDALV